MTAWIGDACETELEDISSDMVTTNKGEANWPTNNRYSATGRKIVNGSDVKQRIDRLYDRIVALLEAEINHDVRGYEVANSVCQRLATRLCDINIAYLLPRALDDYGILAPAHSQFPVTLK
jgi:hypothetical protein